MARGVLGNDPFKRAAAVRADEQRADAPAEPKAEEKPKKAPAKKKSAPKKKAAPAGGKRNGKRAAVKRAVAEAPVAAPEPSPQVAEVVVASTPAPEAPPAAEVAALPEVEVTTPYGTPVVEVEEVHPLPAQSEAGFLVRGRDLVAAAATSGTVSRVLETATGLLRAVQSGLGTAGGANLDDFGKDAALAQQLRGLADFFYKLYWRVTVEGAEHVPEGPCILVANHSGALPFDGPVLHAALTRERGDLPEARWLVEDQVFHAPFLGTLLNRLGAVRACPENANRLLEEGRPVIVFPEGVQGLSKPYRERYRLMRFGRGGFVKIALKARVPIVPVAIVGAEEAMPMLARLPGKWLGVPYLPLTSPVPLPSKWTVRFGEPIRIDQYSAQAADDLVLVHQVTDKTREAVQGMLDALLKERDSVFA